MADRVTGEPDDGAEVNWAAITAVVGTVGGVVLGYLGYWRSRKVDDRSAQLGVTSETRAGTDQVIAGLRILVEQWQESDQDKKETIRYLDVQLRACMASKEDEKRENARLRKKYGNGD